MSKIEAMPAGGVDEAGYRTRPARDGGDPIRMYAVPKLKRALTYKERKIDRMTKKELLIFLFISEIDLNKLQAVIVEKYGAPASERKLKHLAQTLRQKKIDKLGDDETVATFNQFCTYIKNTDLFYPPLTQLQLVYVWCHVVDSKHQGEYSQRISTKKGEWSTEQFEQYVCEFLVDLIGDPDKIMDPDYLAEMLEP